MRLFMTPAGEEAWYAALVRNVRMQLTRIEIGELDIYTLSGAKQAGQTLQQFRATSYQPDWQPDYNMLLANDTIAFASDLSNVGYWKVQQNDGGIIVRIPATAANMSIGNVRIYAKNTGPYPYASMKAQPYRRYEEVYDDEHGGEIMLFAGFSVVADPHWKHEDAFPHFVDIRLSIHAEGLFNVIDRSQFAFESVISVFEADTEKDLNSPGAFAYGCAVVASHSKTNRPAVFYRSPGARRWIGYPLNTSWAPTLDDPTPIADTNIDTGVLDHGVIDPPEITTTALQGTVISSQPRKILLPDLVFTKKDVESWAVTTDTVAVNIQPNIDQPYITRVRTADLAFLGSNQQLYLRHNTTRYRLCAKGRAYDTPPIVFKHGDLLSLEGILEGPVSSLTGSIYAELNEDPISVDANNTSTWLLGKVAMHINCTVPVTPDKMVFGKISRRLSGYSWDERTPEMYISGLGHDIYGIPQTMPVTIRVVPTEHGTGGTSFSYGGGQMDGSVAPSYLAPDFKETDGDIVIRRGITGDTGTAISLYHNGVNVGTLSTVNEPEKSITINVQDGDRIGLRIELYGSDKMLPGAAIAIEGISSQGFRWFEASFDVAATFGPDDTEPTFNAMPALPAPTALPQTIGHNSFGDMLDNYLIQTDTVDAVVTTVDPTVVLGPWLSLMAAPNPTLAVTNAPIELRDLVITGTATNGTTIELVKFDPYNAETAIVLVNENVVVPGLVIANLEVGDSYRARVTFQDPDVRVQAVFRITTDAGYKDLLIDSTVRSA